MGKAILARERLRFPFWALFPLVLAAVCFLAPIFTPAGKIFPMIGGLVVSVTLFSLLSRSMKRNMLFLTESKIALVGGGHSITEDLKNIERVEKVSEWDGRAGNHIVLYPFWDKTPLALPLDKLDTDEATIWESLQFFSDGRLVR